MDFLQLGATLYVPATRHDIVEIANQRKFCSLKSVVFCTEDAILKEELPDALANLHRSLHQFCRADMMRFIRPRNPQTLCSLLNLPGIQKIDGFVLPKATVENLKIYSQLLERHESFWIMITLETEEVFDPEKMRRMRDVLANAPYKNRILTIRIGGLDLLNILGIRRVCDRTIYDTPVGHCIYQLVSIFKPLGFNLSAPAYECFENFNTLMDEVELDLLNGLFGKTAIHPQQINFIQSAYRVSRQDIEMAKAILDSQSPAVFRMHNIMCEKATHEKWARAIIERSKIYGVYEGRDMNLTRNFFDGGKSVAAYQI